jgi:hypothetical protein
MLLRQEHDDALVAGLTPPVGHAGQLRQQVLEVVFIACCLAGITGRPYSGATAERIHLQARVVGEGREPRASGRMAGLEQGIVEKGGAGLRSALDAELGLGDELERKRGQQRLHLAQLPRIAAGEHGWDHGARSA